MFLYSLSLESNVYDIIVGRIKYEYAHNLIVIGCVCVRDGDGVGWGVDPLCIYHGYWGKGVKYIVFCVHTIWTIPKLKHQ